METETAAPQAKPSSRGFDFAIAVSIATGVAYMLAWQDLHAFNSYFGVPDSFLDLGLGTFLSALIPTGMTVVGIAGAILAGIRPRSGPPEYIPADVVPLALLIYLNVFAVSLGVSLWITTPIVLSAFFLVFVAERKLWIKPIQLRPYFQSSTHRVVAVFFVFLFTVVLYLASGHMRARRVASGSGPTRVRVATVSNRALPPSLVFVTRSQGFVFVCEPIDGATKPTVYAIIEPAAL